jgi:hypothetical protein
VKEERVSQVTKEENVRIEQEIECPRSKTCFLELIFRAYRLSDVMMLILPLNLQDSIDIYIQVID